MITDEKLKKYSSIKISEHGSEECLDYDDINDMAYELLQRRKEVKMLCKEKDICGTCYDLLDEEDKQLEVNQLRSECREWRENACTICLEMECLLNYIDDIDIPNSTYNTINEHKKLVEKYKKHENGYYNSEE